jgi:hypothetical protein
MMKQVTDFNYIFNDPISNQPTAFFPELRREHSPIKQLKPTV